MKKAYDVVQAKEIPDREKPKWLNIGTAFEKEGNITGIKIDVLPIPDNKGEIWLRLFEQKKKQDNNDNSEPL